MYLYVCFCLCVLSVKTAHTQRPRFGPPEKLHMVETGGNNVPVPTLPHTLCTCTCVCMCVCVPRRRLTVENGKENQDLHIFHERFVFSPVFRPVVGRCCSRFSIFSISFLRRGGEVGSPHHLPSARSAQPNLFLFHFVSFSPPGGKGNGKWQRVQKEMGRKCSFSEIHFPFPCVCFYRVSRVPIDLSLCCTHCVFLVFHFGTPGLMTALLAARFSSDPAVRAAQHSLGFQICCFLRFLPRFPRLLRPFPCLVLRWCALFLSFSFSLFLQRASFRFSLSIPLQLPLLFTSISARNDLGMSCPTTQQHQRAPFAAPPAVYGSPGSFIRAYVHVCLAVYVCMCVCVCALGRGYVWVSLPAMLTRSTPLPISCARFI